MNVGRIVLGTSTALAVVAAVGFVAVTTDIHPTNVSFATTASPIATPRIGVCGSPGSGYPDYHSMSASFLIKNTSGKAIRILALRPTDLTGLASARVTILPGADPVDRPGWRHTAAVGVQDETITKSAPLAADGSTRIAAHSFVTVITDMVLDADSQAGGVGSFQLTIRDPRGVSQTQTIHTSVALGRTPDACSDIDA